MTGDEDAGAETFKASDGVAVLEMDLKTGQSQSQPLPDFGQEKQFVPPLVSGYAYPQPLWGQMGTSVSLMAFPSDFAQSEGIFKPVATEFIAGRETFAVEWTYASNELPSWRMWLDAEAAVILKMQQFGKEGSETLQSEIVINQIVYDPPFADDLFRAPASLPQFSDISGTPLTSAALAPTASSDPDPLREVYFFVTDHAYRNETIQLLQVPGSCAVGLAPCPEAQVISTPFDLKFSLPSLVWSPDGAVAAFPYPTNEDGDRAALFMFDPQVQTWQSLAEFNFIDPPFWSPDGEWLAFRTQEGNGVEDIYAVRRDGTQLTNLSALDELPQEDHPYVLNGWVNNHVVLRGSRAETVYLVRVDDGAVRPLFEIPWAKSNFVPSPDGYFLAYAEVSGQTASLKLLTPNGNTTRELAAFQDAWIFPITWSPDGTSLAFAARAADPDIR